MDGKPTVYSSLNERELFIFDLESILKVLTFKETCLLVFPCLEVFAIEQEYLKIELFRQLPHLFTKVMKTDAKVGNQKLTKEQLIDILTVNLFPLISQLLMISDETVQQEGINAMVKVCKDNILPREDGCFLMHNVAQILFKKCDQLENPKVGVLMLLETFVREGFFGKEVCTDFVQNKLEYFTEDKLFKIRRPLLKCLISMSKHLS